MLLHIIIQFPPLIKPPTQIAPLSWIGWNFDPRLIPLKKCTILIESSFPSFINCGSNKYVKPGGIIRGNTVTYYKCCVCKKWTHFSSSSATQTTRSELSDGLIRTYDEHEESVYACEWSASDSWVFASLSYDGRVILNKTPQSVKYNILNLWYIFFCKYYLFVLLFIVWINMSIFILHVGLIY